MSNRNVVYYRLHHITPEEGVQIAQQHGRVGLMTLYWWRGPDGTRYYTPPLRGLRVFGDDEGRWVEA